MDRGFDLFLLKPKYTINELTTCWQKSLLHYRPELPRASLIETIVNNSFIKKKTTTVWLGLGFIVTKHFLGHEELAVFMLHFVALFQVLIGKSDDMPQNVILLLLKKCW